jgi:putative ABC transport system ATP-binding protein
MSDSMVLRLEGVAKIYPGDPPVDVLRDVQLLVRAGEMLSIVGPSGSGKSTLLHIMGTLDRASEGVVSVNGNTVTRMSDHQLSRLRARTIGFVFQHFFMLEEVSALDNVAAGLLYQGVDRRQRRRLAATALERVGLGHRLTHRPSKLSGGERQRVAIARAIAAQPSVLVCDEVTSALDVSVQAAIVELIEELRRELGLGLLFVTHNLALISTIADTVSVMSRGNIVEHGRVRSVLDAPRQAYTQELLADTPTVEAAV